MKGLFFILLFSYISYSQPFKEEEKKINIDSLLQTDEYIGIQIEKHIVKKGERMKNIYMKYKISPGEIYRLNPEAKDSLKVGSTLLIPLEKKVVYREWLNPKWVKQNEAKLLIEVKVKDSIENKKRTDKANKETASVNENKKSSKSKKKTISKKEVLNEVKDIKEPVKVVEKPKEIIAADKPKEIIVSKEIITNDILNDTINKKEFLTEKEFNKKEKKSKKKKKEEVKYGTPDDHDIFLDSKNKEHYVLHEIEEGETLIKIAKKYNVPDYALLEFNKKVDFNKVTAGNVMKVPDKNKEVVQKYIFDLISVYSEKNIKYDKKIVKKEFTYTNDETE